MRSDIRLSLLAPIALAVGLFGLGCSDSSSAPAPDGGGGSDAGGGDDDAGGGVDAGGGIDAGPPPPPEAGEITALRLTDGAGNTWVIDGRADTADEALTSLPGHNAFWFAWSVFHPGTDIWAKDDDIRDHDFDASGECLVPCDEIRAGCGGGLDCIPPLDDPEMVSADSSELGYLGAKDLVVGVMTPEGPRAYPHNILWWHEIANEEIGGFAYAATLCPLTGSALLFDRTRFVEGKTVRLGVSGNLYNSNLVMWDSDEPNPRDESDFSFWPQMWLGAVAGPEKGADAPLLPTHEMTWEAWRALHPDTLVVSENTGFGRDYNRYPYGDYRTNDGDTFRPTNPPPDPTYEAKDMTFGLVVEGSVRAYAWKELEAQTGARQGVVNDELGGVPVAIVFDLDSQYVHAFDRRVGGEAVELSLEEIEESAAP